MDREAVVQCVYRALDDLNETRAPDQRVAKSPQATLLGTLDSMGLVNLIVMAEERLLDDLGVGIDLADQDAAQAPTNPLTTVETFVDYIQQRIEAGETT